MPGMNSRCPHSLPECHAPTLKIAYQDGWGHVAMPSINGAGTPLIGAAFSRATSTNIGAGVSGNFGLAWEHRYVRPGDVIP